MNRYGRVVMPAAILAFVLAGCHGNQNQASNASTTQPASGDDPASVNLAPAGNVTTASNAENPPPPPPDQDANGAPAQSQSYSAQPDQSGDDQDTADDVAPQPPPPLPDYDQPPAPGDDYLWTPGYWAYASNGYYWVPGEWVMAPWVGALWTPGYWGFYGGRYHWYHGYWGPHVGFYGGVNYGYGYDGNGYEGGYWRDNRFYYNRAITHVDTNRVHNVYNYRVANRNTARVSYNGGNGGLNARPTQAQLAARNERHVAPLPAQRTTAQNAQRNPAQFDRTNHGHPQNVAETQPMNDGRQAPAAHPGDFHPSTTPRAPQGQAAQRTGAAHPAPLTNLQRPTAHPVYNNHPAPQTRTATRTETRPAQPQQRSTEQPRSNGNAQPPQHVGARPRPQVQPRQVQPRQEQPRQEQPRQEQPRQVQPRPEQHPAPQPRPQQPRQQQPRQQEPRPQQPHPENKGPA